MARAIASAVIRNTYRMLVAMVQELPDDVRRTSVPVYAFALSEALCVASPRLV